MNAGQRPLLWRGSTRVVVRSAALLGYAAPGFRYDEAGVQEQTAS